MTFTKINKKTETQYFNFETKSSFFNPFLKPPIISQPLFQFPCLIFVKKVSGGKLQTGALSPACIDDMIKRSNYLNIWTCLAKLFQNWRSYSKKPQYLLLITLNSNYIVDPIGHLQCVLKSLIQQVFCGTICFRTPCVK